MIRLHLQGKGYQNNKGLVYDPSHPTRVDIKVGFRTIEDFQAFTFGQSFQDLKNLGSGDVYSLINSHEQSYCASGSIEMCMTSSELKTDKKMDVFIQEIASILNQEFLYDVKVEKNSLFSYAVGPLNLPVEAVTMVFDHRIIRGEPGYWVRMELKCRTHIVDAVKKWLHQNFDSIPMKSVVKVVEEISQQPPHLVFSEQVIGDADERAFPEFYPWITQDLDLYFHEFMESSANILVMIGPPGTGKSTFIRTVLANSKTDATMVYRQQAMLHPSFMSLYKNSVESSAMKNNPSLPMYQPMVFGRGTVVETHTSSDQTPVLVLEDAEYLMTPRSEGNPAMSEILNTSNGVIKSKMKFIFTTNLDSIDKIDPALLRPGRCFDVLPFRKLTPAEAHKLLVVMKMDPSSIPDRDLTLAELLGNKSSPSSKTEMIVQPRFKTSLH